MQKFSISLLKTCSRKSLPHPQSNNQSKSTLKKIQESHRERYSVRDKGQAQV
jgi:hypothetical protein